MPASIVLPSPTSSARIAAPAEVAQHLEAARIWCGKRSTPRSESSDTSRSALGPARPRLGLAAQVEVRLRTVLTRAPVFEQARRPAACQLRAGRGPAEAAARGGAVARRRDRLGEERSPTTMSQSRCAESRRSSPSNTTSSTSRPRSVWTSTMRPSPNCGWCRRWPTWYAASLSSTGRTPPPARARSPSRRCARAAVRRASRRRPARRARGRWCAAPDRAVATQASSSRLVGVGAEAVERLRSRRARVRARRSTFTLSAPSRSAARACPRPGSRRTARCCARRPSACRRWCSDAPALAHARGRDDDARLARARSAP